MRLPDNVVFRMPHDRISDLKPIPPGMIVMSFFGTDITDPLKGERYQKARKKLAILDGKGGGVIIAHYISTAIAVLFFSAGLVLAVKLWMGDIRVNVREE